MRGVPTPLPIPLGHLGHLNATSLPLHLPQQTVPPYINNPHHHLTTTVSTITTTTTTTTTFSSVTAMETDVHDHHDSYGEFFFFTFSERKRHWGRYVLLHS